MEWKKGERIEKRKLITIIRLIFNSIRNLNQHDHRAKAPLFKAKVLAVLSGPHTLLRLFFIVFFSLLSFSAIENYSVPGLGYSAEKKKQSFL